MHLLLVGAEYSGTTTLGYVISKWAKENMGVNNFGFHDHWKIPHVSHPGPMPDGKTAGEIQDEWFANNGKGLDPTMMGHTDEENEQFLALSPKIKEAFQRYHMQYHLSDSFYRDAHHNQIGFHIDEAVLAPLYYGYGDDGEYAGRSWFARLLEHEITEKAPDTVLILVKADPDVIKNRSTETPHPFSLLEEKDIEKVVDGYAKQFEMSFIRNKFEIDTGNNTIEDCLKEFAEKIEPMMTEEDRLRTIRQQLCNMETSS